MSKLVQKATDDLKQAITAAVNTAIQAGTLPEAPLPAFTLEVPADRSHGDWAANIAMAGARAFKCAPRKIAEAITANIDLASS